ncbi:MAG: hypothetical protein JJT89_04395, partial [Nitriliruptoraceae bacterium]|nr:hypothetical protein [Nitriliruptoraceae bacterium]
MDPVALLAPSRCLACGARGAVPFCAPCGARLPILHRGCDRCAAPRGAAHACWPPDAPVDATIAVYDYRGPVSAGIAAAKLRGARASWPLLGAPLAQAVLAREPDLDVVTWVTTPRPRVRQRGVDHAQVLGRPGGAAGGGG